jgi:hypothetical protein
MTIIRMNHHRSDPPYWTHIILPRNQAQVSLEVFHVVTGAHMTQRLLKISFWVLLKPRSLPRIHATASNLPAARPQKKRPPPVIAFLFRSDFREIEPRQMGSGKKGDTPESLTGDWARKTGKIGRTTGNGVIMNKKR